MNKITKILFSAFLFFSVFASYSAKAQGFSDGKTTIVGFIPNYDVLIYPNPVTNNKFYVRSDRVIKSVEVMNILGQNIKTVNNETNVPYNILVELGDIRDIKKGMYMVRITFDDEQSIIQKIILK
ncbi:MAG: T9SS type A sorting domain-containing protein [Bacteroidales bacterium]|nr:T9SS type A sorting domain-containing protein [Bacteroidales bacterium]